MSRMDISIDYFNDVVDRIALQSTLVARKLHPQMRLRLGPLKSFLDIFTVQADFFQYHPICYGYADNSYTMDCILYSNGRHRV